MLYLCVDGQSLTFYVPREHSSGYVNNKREQYDFHMTRIFPPKATQEDIFDGIGKQVVQNVLSGFNGMCMCT